MKRPIQVSDIGRRVARASAPLASELLRRGMLASRETQEVIRAMPAPKLTSVRSCPRVKDAVLASELANADRKVAAKAVLARLLSRRELLALGTMLKFQPHTARDAKLNELVRVVERASEGGVNGDC